MNLIFTGGLMSNVFPFTSDFHFQINNFYLLNKFPLKCLFNLNFEL